MTSELDKATRSGFFEEKRPKINEINQTLRSRVFLLVIASVTIKVSGD